MSMIKLTLLTLLFLTCLTNSYAKRYEYLSHDQILDRMKELAEKNPRYCKLIDITKESSHTSNIKCDKDNCKEWYLKISDFNALSEHINTLPQVLFMGDAHNDEAIGPNIVINLAEYLLKQNKEDRDITNLIRSRVIILLPLVNSDDFSGKGEDLASARIISHVFKTHPIQAAVLFQQGDQSITYSCRDVRGMLGITNNGEFKSQECPNDKALLDVARIMSKEAGSNHHLFIKPFTIKKMPNFDPTLKDYSNNTTFNSHLRGFISPHIISDYDSVPQESISRPLGISHGSQSFKTSIYLVKTSGSSQPGVAYLGSSEGLNGREGWYTYGYIPINIKLSLALLDTVETYIRIKTLDYSKKNKTLMVRWQGGGCKNVDKTYVEWTNKEGKSEFSGTTKHKQGPGYYEYKDYVYQEIIHLNDTKFNMDFTIKLACDQDGSLKKNSDSSNGFQTFVVKEHHAKVSGHKSAGKKIVELTLRDITADYFRRNKIKNVEDLSLNIQFLDCSNLKKIGSLTTQVVDDKNKSSLQIDGTLKVEESNLEGHLHKYGDISHCFNSTGKRIDIANFKSNYVDHEVSPLFTVSKTGLDTLKVNHKLNLTKGDNIFDMIGTSVVLKNDKHPKKLYVGQVVPAQPDSCTKSDEMKDCIGFNLGSHDGICTVRVTDGSSVHNLNLFLQPEIDGLTIGISGLIPDEVMDYYEPKQILIVHENTSKNFKIDKEAIQNYGLIKEDSFNLSPDIALGTVLRAYIYTSGKKLLLGDCSVGLKDSNFNESQLTIRHPTDPFHEDSAKSSHQILHVVIGLIILVILGILIGLLVKRNNEFEKNFEDGVVIAGKEKHIDITNMVATGKDIEIVGEGDTYPPAGNTQDYVSPGSAFNLAADKEFTGGKNQVLTPSKVASNKSGDYIIFPEEERDGEISG